MRARVAHMKRIKTPLCAQGVRSAIGRKQVRGALQRYQMSTIACELLPAQPKALVFPWCAVKPQMLRRITRYCKRQEEAEESADIDLL
jgi:hypothetical protein